VIVLGPPSIAAAVLVGEFREERGVAGWLRLVPVSYPATGMLGLAVIQMVAITPVLLVQRLRRGRTLVQVPLVMRKGTGDDDLHEAVHAALTGLGIGRISTERATGIAAWPMRTVGFAARHLLGSVVRGEPMQLRAGTLDLFVYATDVAVLGPKEAVYRVRAAVERELALDEAYLTWSDDAQRFEDELREALAATNGQPGTLAQRLDRIQAEIDAADLNSEEWSVLSRLRLEAELARTRSAAG
jgi:hypothetical protein